MTGSAGQKRIPTEFVKNLQIPLPPLHEQQKIAQYLDKKTQQIDQLIQKTEKEIKLIKEFKEKLISDAVLGKIKV
ncbi:restriction endonuclease subunit S [Hydrogenivirga sp. 128-5-R1-1]|uniref:restriction endonuclease subunit S n=1 Tax=Hydrogenivirga sp. 128-5-R1-1 TaxID=392423 RepID=UPI00030102B5|nr:restriction endonuclease subunit S [Hydrogenivirga sp. 128-5-R1-1]